MSPEERRRRGNNREKYPVLRFYAKIVNLSSLVVATVGVVFAALIAIYAEQPPLERATSALIALGVALFYFVVARGTAEMIYLLVDVAQNARITRELLEAKSTHKGGSK